MDNVFRNAALDYHRLPRPGKLSVEPTKRMATQHDLALAYSPGIAAACEAIAADPTSARDYTAQGNLVAVISNGTAVLGLGNIGPRPLHVLVPSVTARGIVNMTTIASSQFSLDVHQQRTLLHASFVP